MEEEQGQTLLEILSAVDEAELASGSMMNTSKIQGFLIGTLAEVNEFGQAFVELPDDFSHNLIGARTVIPLKSEDVGRDVVLMFEKGDRQRPIVMGLIQQGQYTSSSLQPSPQHALQQIDVRVDGEQVVFNAKKEIVLQCGKASITLTRAGKVLIRGAYILSRSSGVNRIKGGSVQIN